MPDTMNFRHSVTYGNPANQNNNKGRIQPNGKKHNENTIQMRLYNKNDSSNKFYELFHIKATYLKKK